MKVGKKRALLLSCSVALALVAGSAAARPVHHHHYHRHHHAARVAAAPTLFSGFAGSSLVADARKYLGTNPTGRRSLWCGQSAISKGLMLTGSLTIGNAKGVYHLVFV